MYFKNGCKVIDKFYTVQLFTEKKINDIKKLYFTFTNYYVFICKYNLYIITHFIINFK